MAKADRSETDGGGDDGVGVVDARAIFGGADDNSSGDGGGSNHDGGNDSGTGVRRRRGRPPGSGNKNRRKAGSVAPSQASVSASIDGLSRALLLFHFGVANGVHAATKNPALANVFAIGPQEADAIAVPLAEIMTHYVGDRSPEAQRWINLVMAMAGVYGGKLAAAMMQGQPANAKPAAPQTTH